MRTIGIDPGSRVGLAHVENGKLVSAATFSWRDQRAKIFGWLGERIRRWGCEMIVVVEVPGKSVYNRPGQSRRAMLRIARAVGQCQERAEGIARWCEERGARVIRRSPVRGGTKWTRAMFNAAFPEWEGKRISNHARDASVLCKLEGRGAHIPATKGEADA